MVRLNIICRKGNRMNHLIPELRNLGVEVNTTFLNDCRQKGRIKLVKRMQIRNELFNLAMQNKPKKGGIFLISISPSLLAPLVRKLSKNGFRVILDIRNSYQEWNYHGFLKQQLEKHEQLVGMRNANAITYVHPALYSLLEKHAPREKLFFVTNGASGRIFHYHHNSSFHTIDSNINFVYAGRFFFPHGLYQWLEVMKRLRKKHFHFHLTIIGYGDQSQKLRKMIWNYHLTTSVSIIEKQVSQETLAHYLQRADYALASIHPQCDVLYDTTIETKTFEALCCGTPVLSIQGKAMDQFNESHQLNLNQNFNRQSPGKIAEQLLSLKKSTRRQKEVVSKKALRRFDYQTIANQMKGVIDHVRGL